MEEQELRLTQISAPVCPARVFPELRRSPFDAYYGPFERGGASTGQALATLPDEIRLAVRDEVRRGFGDTSGPIEVEAEYRIASGRRSAVMRPPVPPAPRPG